MHEVKSYEFLLRAEKPIAHHQETFGNHAVVFRRKVRRPDGEWAQVPFITADTLRHGLREAAAYAYLDAAGLLDGAELSEAALRLLFNGGMVTGGSGGGNVKLDDYRKMVDLMPHIALLGGCAANRVMPGRIMCEDAMLVCTESESFLPSWVLEEAGELDSGRSHIEVSQRVRMDSTLDPGKRKLLGAADEAAITKRLAASAKASTELDAVEKDENKSSMMPRTFEALAAGSLFWWRITVTLQSELETDVFHTMVAAFLSNAIVGGKKGTGHGLVRPISARGVVVSRPSERLHAIDALALAPKVGEMFRAHVKERAEKIRPFLAAVDA